MAFGVGFNVQAKAWTYLRSNSNSNSNNGNGNGNSNSNSKSNGKSNRYKAGPPPAAKDDNFLEGRELDGRGGEAECFAPSEFNCRRLLLG